MRTLNRCNTWNRSLYCVLKGVGAYLMLCKIGLKVPLKYHIIHIYYELNKLGRFITTNAHIESSSYLKQVFILCIERFWCIFNAVQNWFAGAVGVPHYPYLLWIKKTWPFHNYQCAHGIVVILETCLYIVYWKVLVHI